MSQLRAHLLAGYLKKLHRSRTLFPENASAAQGATLRSLLKMAAGTAFGRRYDFDGLLRSQNVTEAFRNTVPVHTYSALRDAWWHRTYNGEPSVTWPGFTPYFSMSSGTADAVNKNLPVTRELLHNVKRVGLLQMAGLQAFGVPRATYGKDILMLGSSTDLVQRNNYLEGDMSGISMISRPWWMRSSAVRPGPGITKMRSWKDRITAIVHEAHKWDIGTVCGVPPWVILLFDEILKHYRLKNIHELWPHFRLYIHGGVAFTHYEPTFVSLLGTEVIRQETYMASEGSFGFQSRPGGGIMLVPDAGVFFEFIPFGPSTFDEHGNPLPGAEVLPLSQVREGEPYAVVLTTCGGAWRYLIGDVVSFTNASLGEINIVGRTRQFLDLCGEHVSADNMNRAIREACRQQDLAVGEFAVAGESHELLFAHRWYIGCDGHADSAALVAAIDRELCALNDDYRVVRRGTLQDVKVQVLPNEVFRGFLRSMNRDGAMTKFPRVLSGATLVAWNEYLSRHAPAATLAGTGGSD